MHNASVVTSRTLYRHPENASWHAYDRCHHGTQCLSSLGRHCPWHTVFDVQKNILPSAIHQGPFIVWIPSVHPFKKELNACRFWSDEDVKAMVGQQFLQQSRELFAEGNHRKVCQQNACLSACEASTLVPRISKNIELQLHTTTAAAATTTTTTTTTTLRETCDKCKLDCNGSGGLL